MKCIDGKVYMSHLPKGEEKSSFPRVIFFGALCSILVVVTCLEDEEDTIQSG